MVPTTTTVQCPATYRPADVKCHICSKPGTKSLEGFETCENVRQSSFPVSPVSGRYSETAASAAVEMDLIDMEYLEKIKLTGNKRFLSSPFYMWIPDVYTGLGCSFGILKRKTK